jgi:hypothetical protein
MDGHMPGEFLDGFLALLALEPWLFARCSYRKKLRQRYL